MKKKIIRYIIILQILTIPVGAVAADNVQIIDSQLSEKELVVKNNDKFLLDKDWYNYEFELNPVKEAGNLALQAVDSEEYMKALEEITIPLEKVGNYKIYFMEYKLKKFYSALALSFKDGSAVVFGTYHKLSAEKIHQMAVHELGHHLDFQFMDKEKWREYKKLRAITNENKYNNSSKVYMNRSQEIFAEDFRLLFGGELAVKIPHLNKDLVHPSKVEGLKELYLSILK